MMRMVAEKRLEVRDTKDTDFNLIQALLVIVYPDARTFHSTMRSIDDEVCVSTYFVSLTLNRSSMERGHARTRRQGQTRQTRRPSAGPTDPTRSCR